MSYSTKAIIIQPDKQGFSRVHIRYTYNRKTNSISIDEKIKAENFDSDKGLAKPKYAGANDINIKIRQAQAELEDIASGLANPEFAQVKEIYLKRTEESRERKKRERNKEKLDSVINHFDAEEIEEQILYHQTKLAELIAKQKELSLKGFGLSSFEHNELLKHLAEFSLVHTAKPVYKKQIDSFSNRFNKFIQKNNIILSYDIFDHKLETAFKQYLKTEHEASMNYIGSNIKKLKAFLTWAEENKAVTINKSYKKYKVDKEEIDVIYLTKEELDYIWDYKKECKPEYIKYIDICVFGNLTGLRISDITKSVFQIDNGFLKGRTKKTGGNFQIPLIFDDRILGILKEYNFDLKRVSDQKYNKYIKEICKLVFEKHKINQQPIKILKKVYAEAEPKEEFKMKHELIASHSNRRGFCTRAFQNGWSEPDILLMLGSKSTEILRGYVKNDEVNLMERAKKKMEDKDKEDKKAA